ncbi:Zinc finger BED domain-containing protein RICESLEEPER 2 [Linum grandiflorum]
MCIATDNASSNDTAISYMKKKLKLWNSDFFGSKYLHIRCVAHIINLVVTDGLKESGISIERVREAVKWVKSSPARLAQFKKCISFKGIESNRLVSLDVSTRWNSTYMMMEAAEKYEDAFKLLEGNDCNFKSHLDRQIFPTFMDWENVRMLMKYFKFFYDMTIRVSGTSYVTTHLFCKELIDVYDEIHDLLNRLLYIAVFLDPRRKFEYVEFILSKMYEPERAENLAKEVKDAIYEMFGYYKQLLASNVQPRVSSPNVRDDGNVPASRRKEGTNAEFMKKKVESISRGSRKVSKSELEKYMSNDEDLNASNYDILGWWMRNEMRYPILSAMARDILAVPITTVASESTFSTGGRILDSFRTSLTPTIVEALICARDWIKSDNSKMVVDEEDLAEQIEFENGNTLFLLLFCPSSILLLMLIYFFMSSICIHPTNVCE